MKTLAGYGVRIIGATVVLTVLAQFFEWLFGIPSVKSDIVWSILSNFLITLVLSYIVLRSDLLGWRLSGLIFLVFGGIYMFNSQIEALLFNVIPNRGESVRLFIASLMIAAMFSLAFTGIWGRWKGVRGESVKRIDLHYGGLLWRGIVSAVLYLVFYFIAGAIVFPFVQDFYARLTMPGMDQIVPVGFFRGLVFTAIALAVIRSVEIKPLGMALLIGVLFAVLGGIAPLLVPNPYMPAAIRHAHMLEVGISNLLYGLIVGILFKKYGTV